MTEQLLSGRRAVSEAIRTGAAREILVAQGARRTPGLRELLEAADTSRIRIREVPRPELDALANDHRGVIARVRTTAQRPLGERELMDFAYSDEAFVVVLDGVEDPQNFGAAVRSAEAAGAAMLVTRTHRAAPATPAAVRASAGALLHLPIARVANIARALARLQQAGFVTIGLDETADGSVYDDPCPDGRVAIVVGSEGTGLSRLVRERCDVLVALPMMGRVASLNAAAALAAVLYAYVVPSRVARHR